MRILVRGDNHPAAAFIGHALTTAGCVVEVLSAGNEPVPPAAVVLHCDRPACDETCPVRQLRTPMPGLPVLVVAARGSDDVLVECLKAGADDYVAEPLAVPVLLARLQALIRRVLDGLVGRGVAPCQPVAAQRILEYAGLTVDLATHKARRDNVEVELNRREFLFLKLVMGEPGKYFAKATIFKAWDYRGSRPSTLLENVVSRLRAKLDTGFGTRLIHNKSGKGYKIDVEG